VRTLFIVADEEQGVPKRPAFGDHSERILKEFMVANN